MSLDLVEVGVEPILQATVNSSIPPYVLRTNTTEV